MSDDLENEDVSGGTDTSYTDTTASGGTDASYTDDTTQSGGTDASYSDTDTDTEEGTDTDTGTDSTESDTDTDDSSSSLVSAADTYAQSRKVTMLAKGITSDGDTVIMAQFVTPVATQEEFDEGTETKKAVTPYQIHNLKGELVDQIETADSTLQSNIDTVSSTLQSNIDSINENLSSNYSTTTVVQSMIDTTIGETIDVEELQSSIENAEALVTDSLKFSLDYTESGDGNVIYADEDEEISWDDGLSSGSDTDDASGDSLSYDDTDTGASGGTDTSYSEDASGGGVSITDDGSETETDTE